MNKEYFTCMAAMGAGQSRQGARVETASSDDLRHASAKTISAAGE